MSGHKIKIYSDFDGTITNGDVWDTWIRLGNHFIKDKEKWSQVIRDFEAQKIGARECYHRELELMEGFNLDEFNRIIDTQPLDSGFLEFLKFCTEQDIPFTILSEGMDYYIERILLNNNLVLPYYANRLLIADDKKSIALDFPYSDSECTKCGCCKRNLLMNMTGDDEISILIGDGYSDTCVAHYADIVFAKKALASYCWKNNITYFDYVTFNDIRKKIEKIISQKKFNQRQTAKLNRRSLFLRG